MRHLSHKVTQLSLIQTINRPKLVTASWLAYLKGVAILSGVSSVLAITNVQISGETLVQELATVPNATAATEDLKCTKISNAESTTVTLCCCNSSPWH